MGRAFAWVIVRYRTPGAALMYWGGNNWPGSTWVHNHLDAVRFCRQEDANKTLEWCYNEPAIRSQGMRIEEHGWLDGDIVEGRLS